ncbi:hypothetical protein T4B_6549 [Trichinella pseudospiralis]|uniref:Uncharacterized protein n=1 Tax=Trichinella pseudospiralis TaxID=6337 RepID=A0A0V1JRN5_TRIPS|nr:hypothetical protein T4A_9089 [Trichinella pseudospiralis]KRZ20846.1 hypothetical protein T4B_6549 [Trichinella pseudospiralis]KRZ37657.1 hypothetical protein T4C_2604 [Trichinella pseudospiralis]
MLQALRFPFFSFFSSDIQKKKPTSNGTIRKDYFSTVSFKSNLKIKNNVVNLMHLFIKTGNR